MKPRQVVVQGQLRPAWMTPGRKEFPGVSRRTTGGEIPYWTCVPKRTVFWGGMGKGLSNGWGRNREKVETIWRYYNTDCPQGVCQSLFWFSCVHLNHGFFFLITEPIFLRHGSHPGQLPMPTGILFTTKNLSEAPFSLCSRAPLHGTSTPLCGSPLGRRVSPRAAEKRLLAYQRWALMYELTHISAAMVLVLADTCFL